MHHRALRLLPSTLSFSSILQAAAARAWVRSTTSTAPPLSSPSPTAHDKLSKLGRQPASKRHKPPRIPPEITVVQSPPNQHESSFRASVEREKAQFVPHAGRRTRPQRTSPLAYFTPELVHDSDLWPPDPARSHVDLSDTSEHHPSPLGRPWYWDDASIIGTPIGLHVSRTRATSLFPLAKTASSLIQNILHLLSYNDPSPTFPALLDYHDLHAGLRSTRSYNLLIFLALRTGSYGTVPWLLSSMRAESVPANLETWKLRVRWLVQSGWWDRAWNEVMSTLPRTNVLDENETKRRFQVTNALPLPIWLEFFRTLKRGATRQRTRIQEALETCESTSTTPNPSEQTDLYLTRYHTLMNNRPTIIPHDLAQTSPRAVYSVVSIMLQLQESDKALSLTKAYFTSLSSRISKSQARTCLDIVHLHIAMGSPHRGLRQLYETRRTMVSLISLHPALRPTSTTLFLLLAPLRRAKRCGTVAWSTLRAFKSQWGAATEDRRVRRRVATLALKEGRMEIVDAMLRSERVSRWARATWKLTEGVVGKVASPRPGRILRPAVRRIFKHNGQEERYWCRLMRRVSRKQDRRK
ncbi:hypothetical protein D9615_001435 [Tricholomella constricta]|uniref:Uncharacterized protein n=1 Tax=Tricholomella constricta TaxID=117010 RepID=A0A8H5HLB1_9AGAR|nr:hypothetical protein D9615_001435 [Tricholomella constricta]